MSVLPSPVKSAGTIRSLGDPNCRAKVAPVELLFIHHSETPTGRKIAMSVLPSPSKSNGARGVDVAAPPQKPVMIVKGAPADVDPAMGCPIVESIVNDPPVERPPPPAITDLVIVNVPPDCAGTLNAEIKTIDKAARIFMFLMFTANL